MQRRYSVAKIDSPIAYEGGKPKAGGLSDPRLGTMDRGQKCTTDGASSQDSPGYFGHIELAKPVYHIGFISTVVKVLRCVSFHSSKLLVSPVSRRPSLFAHIYAATHFPPFKAFKEFLPVLSGSSNRSISCLQYHFSWYIRQKVKDFHRHCSSMNDLQ